MKHSKIKRITDVIGSVFLLVFLWPIIVGISLLILPLMGRPILFRQKRAGLNGKPFWIYKFRTMTDERDIYGNLLSDDKRLTRFGMFLRKTSFDELPGLWDVLRGDMSLVGSRPFPVEYLDRYTPEQLRRHEVKPGIVGWAQVNGRNAISWEEKFKLDVWYVDNWSIWLDIKIIFMAVWKVLKMEGISQPGQATMEEFKGCSSKN